MQKFIAIFPLRLVVYPGQQLNLHIFEERYKQLIRECFENGKTFAIPPVIDSYIYEYATEIRLAEIVHTTPTGEMDIRTEATGILKVLEVIPNVPDKLYSAAIVSEVPHLPFDTDELNSQLYELILKLHRQLGTGFDPYKKFSRPLSFDVASYCALPLPLQCRLLEISSEKQRQLALIQHLMQVIPTLEETEKLRERVNMNGHFRNEIPPEHFGFRK
ncbi:MAG: LON peptidase substrate-binding domain-containing protein [Chitinophagales bacterium]|nr:LON peptidase substrate-binding domain-containing protein [Chitinophagales bacterium]MDW8273586.1 LON peptidase substrate-binding domain-containing protein [Chitinophagales bacterium]